MDLGEYFIKFFKEIENQSQNFGIKNTFFLYCIVSLLVRNGAIKILGQRFPDYPTIENELWILVNLLHDHFNDLFEQIDENTFYIKDSSVTFNYYKKGKISEKIKKFLKDPDNNNELEKIIIFIFKIGTYNETTFEN